MNLAEIRKKNVAKYKTHKNTFFDFPPGTRVKVIVPCCDFSFFYEETGVVADVKHEYLGIRVEFDEPRKFEDGTLQTGFNFNPEDLYILEPTPKDLCPYCRRKFE